MTQPLLDNLLETCDSALDSAHTLVAAAKTSVLALVAPEGRIDAARLESEQQAAHGFAWLTTYVETLRQTLAWARRLDAAGRLGELERLILQAGFGEYLAQMAGGLPMSQGEIIRPADLGLDGAAVHAFYTPAVKALKNQGSTAAVRMRLAALLAEGADSGFFGDTDLAAGSDDETLTLVRDQFHRFGEEVVIPWAHDWHHKDSLIPLEVIEQLSEMGIFGLTMPEAYGGLEMGKTAMCVVSEELSRAYIGVGSLGTRAEIAGELIRIGGTEEQKQAWLPAICAGEKLPTAVFTEPNTGSDLGALRTRAVRDGDTYRITGNKTWITHGARADVMTLLARTNPDEPGYKGLSMFIVEKPRGTDADPFPAAGMSGSEIEVLGYRGMKEYEIAFDDFIVPASSLLGAEEGQGFKQLMATFESARIQTAARAIGVAQSALELGLRYARERQQFGKPIFAFPRVAVKLAWMAVETMMARQVTYFAAREKDSDRRCDIEAGMAKLLAARVAWANADNALQVHGGNGYALEYPVSRVLCDARILNIFEGAAEIQAQVVARGLLGRG